MTNIPKTKGLIWRKTKSGRTPYWRAPDKDFPLGHHINLSALVDDPELLVARCQSLQSEFNAWKMGVGGSVAGFDGTIVSVLRAYQTDADSPYFKLRPGSRHPYDFYLKELERSIGKRRIDSISGVDLNRWHDKWSGDGDRLAASKMARAVLDAAIAFGIMRAKPGSAELRALTDLRTIFKTTSRKIPNPKRREHTVTADDVVRLRQAAHEAGRPSMALAYALVFETTLRLWDVIGQWWPMDAPLISDIVSEPHGSMKESKKWFGIRWEDIGPDLVLRYVPSKTSAKTGLAVTFPLSKAPMVMEELEHWPVRQGPMIVMETTGLPYSSNYFGEFWRKDRDAAGLPKHIWARDLRASGISEARAAGVATDDAAKVAGHASTKTTSAVYDRATLEASERFAEARVKRRAK